MSPGGRFSLWQVGIGLLVLLGGAVVVGLGTGPVAIPAERVAALLLGGGENGDEQVIEAFIVRDLRLPRVLLAILVGALLSQCGAVMQGFFQNPMADPYIIGVSSGAALGATIALTFLGGTMLAGLHAVSLCAFLGALGVTFLVYTISLRGGRLPTALVLLTGVAVSALGTGLTSFILISTQSDLKRILYWLMGGLANRGWDHLSLIAPYALVGMGLVLFFARDLNILLQGEENAQYMGVDVERVKRILLALSALLAGLAVAVSGLIGFVGLVVPHVMRLLVGPDHRILLPASMVGGAILLVWADTLARWLIAPAEIPIGIITSLVGVPFFLFLLSRRRDLEL
ncbi:MAG: iron chelate uptake ABC transporter family permease subunit [Candidatus Latescibacteria bacterium]|nr:iron chelate uptake ABC transporter family permease subunit [Candidatus Latescibacterota bacterium]